MASIILVIIATLQYNEARKEHIAAKAAYQATKEIARVLIRVSYLQFETRNELGSSERLKKSEELVQNDLNKILRLMFPNPNERKAFVQKLKNELPSKQ